MSYQSLVYDLNIDSNNNYDKYRYYNCYLDYKCIKCKKINNPSILPENLYREQDINKMSKLISINNYFPKYIDKLFIYFNFLPDKIKID